MDITDEEIKVMSNQELSDRESIEFDYWRSTGRLTTTHMRLNREILDRKLKIELND